MRRPRPVQGSQRRFRPCRRRSDSRDCGAPPARGGGRRISGAGRRRRVQPDRRPMSMQPAAAAEIAEALLARFRRADRDRRRCRSNSALSIGVADASADGADVDGADRQCRGRALPGQERRARNHTFLRSRHGQTAARTSRDASMSSSPPSSAANCASTTSRRPMSTGKLLGFEALVRWRHPTRGLVPPGVFIPIAEESGLIVEIGDWILRAACREAASWPERAERRGQSVAGSVSPKRSLRADPRRAGRDRPFGQPSRTGNHRRRPDRRFRARAWRSAPRQGARRAHCDGRFRHRLFVALLFAVVPVRQDQDRSVVHLRRRQQSAFGGDRARRPRPCARPPPARPRRRRRDAGSNWPSSRRKVATKCRAI